MLIESNALTIIPILGKDQISPNIRVQISYLTNRNFQQLTNFKELQKHSGQPCRAYAAHNIDKLQS